MKRGPLFADLILGNSNLPLERRMEQILEDPRAKRKPIYLYGPTGCGKTSLLRAMERELRLRWPDLQVTYLTSDDLIELLIQSIVHKDQDDFFRRMTAPDVLMVDDLSFLAEKTSGQMEFLRIAKQFVQEGKLLILASQEQENLSHIYSNPAMSQFLSFHTTRVHLSMPNRSARVAIARMHANALELPLSRDALELIALHAKTPPAVIRTLKHLAILCMTDMAKPDVQGVQLVLDSMNQTE